MAGLKVSYRVGGEGECREISPSSIIGQGLGKEKKGISQPIRVKLKRDNNGVRVHVFLKCV